MASNPDTFAFPNGKQERKNAPLAKGVLDYFKNALWEVAKVSKIGNDQHNPGQELHWAKGKSTDHADCVLRHLAERGTLDDDGMRHSAKLAWRALALLQEELEAEHQEEQNYIHYEWEKEQRQTEDQREADRLWEANQRAMGNWEAEQRKDERQS